MKVELLNTMLHALDKQALAVDAKCEEVKSQLIKLQDQRQNLDLLIEKLSIQRTVIEDQYNRMARMAEHIESQLVQLAVLKQQLDSHGTNASAIDPNLLN